MIKYILILPFLFITLIGASQDKVNAEEAANKMKLGNYEDALADYLQLLNAEPNEITHARVGFISPTATHIDGVAYFEAKLRFDNPPTWFRSGLNADVDIIASVTGDTLRIPKRFLVAEGDARYILVPDGTVTKRVLVEVSFVGNDGFVAITGDVREGDAVIAP